MKHKITKDFLKKIEYPEGKKQLFIYDTELTGFGVRVSSQSISFIIQAVLPGKVKQSRLTIGKFGQITVEDARKVAKKLFYEISQGTNPKAKKEAELEKAVTLGDVVNSYIEARGKNIKQSTVKEIKKHLRINFNDWKDKPVLEITRDKVKSKFLEISKRAPVQANQAFRHLKAWLNYASVTFRPDDKPLFIENPVLIVNQARLWNRQGTRENRIPVNQVGKVWKFLDTLRSAPDTTEIRQTQIDALKMFILTGCRKEEILELEWKHINFDNKYFHPADPKNWENIKIPLSSLAYDILKNRPRINQFVFFSNLSKTGHIRGMRRLMLKISDITGVENPLCIHDIRRTFSSIGNEVGIDEWKIRFLKNYKPQSIEEKHYKEKRDLVYLRPDTEKIASWILNQVDNTRQAKIIKLFAN